ncbi:MAG: hypothetical protein SFX73_19405 [Kofleriaceae bacterium]|nr:hypothetical protein [Kofleriaceae bacterium]
MVPEVRFRRPDQRVVSAGPGAIVGRLYSADVRIDDARVSEAHAYVSLRGSHLVLLALRGRIRIDGRDVPRLELEDGQHIELALGVELVVEEVSIPDHVLALDIPGSPRQILLGVTSVVASPVPRLVSGYAPEAAAVLWSDGLAWRIQEGAQRGRPVRNGTVFVVGGVEIRAVVVAGARAGVVETVPRTAHDRLRIVSQFDTVHIWREDARAPCVLTGMPARLVSELLALGGPVRWTELVELLWRDEADPATLRHRLDILLMKTRRQLTAAGVRRDLLTSHRNGWIELLVYPGDTADDRG